MTRRHPGLQIHVAEKCPRPLVRPAHPDPPQRRGVNHLTAGSASRFFNSLLVRKKLGVAAAKELDGASICVAQGSTNELNLADYFRANGLKYEVVAFATNEETAKAYEAGRCDSLTSDASTLAGQRLSFKDTDDHILLPEVISKEPLGPVDRHGDNQWADLVRWTFMAQVNAEELGVTKANVDEGRPTIRDTDPIVGTEEAVTPSCLLSQYYPAHCSVRAPSTVERNQ